MKVIYKPKGAAGEYADWACNIYKGCSHGCTYCYAPGCMRKTREEYHNARNVTVRENFLELLEQDLLWFHRNVPKEERKLFFSFISDPYQPEERYARFMHHALKLCVPLRIKPIILTKGKCELVRRDFALMNVCGAKLGVSLVFSDDELRKQYEPDASCVTDRMNLLRHAHDYGLETWVSVEPVIDAKQAIDVIVQNWEYVDEFKVGELNHQKGIEIDWRDWIGELLYELHRAYPSFEQGEYLKKVKYKKSVSDKLVKIFGLVDDREEAKDWE